MRLLPPLLLALISSQTWADIEADINTSLGTIVATLHYDIAPQTVANFISLAEGSRDWVDSETGAVRSTPFYQGLTFHERINDAATKLAATGSRDGNGSDDPGYRFPDEFTPSLTHQPYVLAMQNEGPNGNGSRFYFTGSTTLPDRDGVNSVFGSVNGAPSRAVVDAIVAAAPGTVTINSVSIRRTDSPAVAFDIAAQELPTVVPLQPQLQISPGVRVEALLTQPDQTEIRCHQSNSLIDWHIQSQNYRGSDDPASPGPLLIDASPSPASFYRFSSISYQNAATVTNFANRTLTTVTPSAASLIFDFDASGQGGTYQNVIPDPIIGDFVLFQGSFKVRSEIPAHYGPYAFSILLYLFDEELGGSPLQYIQGGYDDLGPGVIQGRQITNFMDSNMDPVLDDKGSFILSSP